MPDKNDANHLTFPILLFFYGYFGIKILKDFVTVLVMDKLLLQLSCIHHTLSAIELKKIM